MNGQYADRIARPQHCADVVGVVDILEDDGQIWLAMAQHVRDALGAAAGPGKLARLARVSREHLPVCRSHQSWHHIAMNNVTRGPAFPG
jgi:hypothetical protein